MRLKRIDISPEFLFDLLKGLEVEESIPEDARYYDFRFAKNDNGDKQLSLIISDNSFEDKGFEDIEHISVVTSAENAEMFKEVMKTFRKIKSEFELERYKVNIGDGENK